MRTAKRYELKDGETLNTYPLAAAVYKSDKTLEQALTHTALCADGDITRTLCRKAKPSSLLEDGSWNGGDADTEIEPTCPTCRARDPRFAK